MKKTATIVVIAVGPGGHRRQGGAPLSHSACGNEGADENSPMISIPVEALSTDSEDGKNVTPEVGDEVTLSDVVGVLKKLDNGEAYVELKSVNGMPVEYEDMEEKSEEAKPMDEQSMRKMVEDYDSKSED
jgi:hypothetical protein